MYGKYRRTLKTIRKRNAQYRRAFKTIGNKSKTVEEPVPSQPLEKSALPNPSSAKEVVSSSPPDIDEYADIDEEIVVGKKKLKYITSVIASIQADSDEKLRKIDDQIRDLKEKRDALKASTKKKLDSLTADFQAVKRELDSFFGDIIIRAIDNDPDLEGEFADDLKKVVIETYKPVREPPFPADAPMAYAARAKSIKRKPL